MGNSTFSGPIRSESTIKTVSKNASTGTITEVITMGDAPVALGDEDKTLDNATHSGRVLAVPAITSDRTITLPAPVAGATFKFIYAGAAEEAPDAGAPGEAEAGGALASRRKAEGGVQASVPN